MKNKIQHRRQMTPSRYQQLGILGHIFGSSGLEINIKSQTFKFESIDKFKQFLLGKIDIPASKMQEMLKRSDQNLAEEVKQLTQVEKKINDQLAATIRDPKSIDNYLDGATMVRFSQDYDWRQIMFELSKQSTDLSEYKLEAVTYYIKYLRSRIKIARDILKDRHHAELENSDPHHQAMMETMQTRAFTVDSGLLANNDERSDKFASTELMDQTQFSKAEIDQTQFSKEKKASPAELKKIPRGQTFIMDARKASQIPLKIASRKFVIKTSNGEPQLISRSGDQYPIKPGENLIGRSTKCTIILNPEFVDVSRQHLIIERYPDDTLHFTDLSSSGTQLPLELIRNVTVPNAVKGNDKT